MATIKKEQNGQDKPKYQYPVYDLWQIDASPIGNQKEDEQAKEYNITAIKIIRKDVKIEKHVADSRNAQSHNSLQRYYPTGSITNGNEERISIK